MLAWLCWIVGLFGSMFTTKWNETGSLAANAAGTSPTVAPSPLPFLPNRIKARPSQSKWRVHSTRSSWPFNNWVTTAFATDNCISGGCATLRLCTMCASVGNAQCGQPIATRFGATPLSFQPDVTFRLKADAFRWPGPARRVSPSLTVACGCVDGIYDH